MTFNYNKLKGKIKEVYGTQNRFAIAMNLSPETVSGKLNNKVQWTQNDINIACLLLKIDPVEIATYFFAH